MKKVIPLYLIFPAILISCKTSQVKNQIVNYDEVRVTDLGYMHSYNPGSRENVSGGKSNNHSTSSSKKTVWNSYRSFIFNKNISLQIKNTEFIYPHNAKKEIGLTSFHEEELLLYAIILKKYAIQNGYDTTYALLANMGQLSSTKRLYLVDLSTMKIREKGLVSHGRGKGASVYVKQYSNTPGSKSTALGKYKIMSPYNGSYGYSYKLAGLDQSNNNALRRNIVFHTMSCIPDVENYAPACVTEGCPAISNQFFITIQPVIENKKSPVLFWIFDSNLQKIAVDFAETGLPENTLHSQID